MKKKLNKVALGLVGIAMIVLMISPVFASDCGCPCTCAPETGKITGGGQGEVEGADGVPAGSFGFNVMWYSRDPGPKGNLNFKDHVTGTHYQIKDMKYLEVWELNPGNKPWPRLFGVFGGPCTIDGVEGFWADISIVDGKEPGKDVDAFAIRVYDSPVYCHQDPDLLLYEARSYPILTGNIQIHKPPK